MASGRIYVCNNCDYEWTSRKRRGSPAFCPKCKSDDFSPEDSKHRERIKEIKAIEQKEKAEKERINAQEKAKKQELKRIERERGITKLGRKEYDAEFFSEFDLKLVA